MSTTDHGDASLPPRPYEVEIRTGTGSINGVFVFSSSASLSTERGFINAEFVPVSYHEAEGQSPSLSTASTHGSQNIKLTNAIVFREDAHHSKEQPLSAIPTASHTTRHGSINIHYPANWAGKVHARTSPHGSSCFNGKGLQVNKDGDGNAWAVKQPGDSDEYDWWGGRGNMNVSLEATETGSISFYVG